MSINLSNTTDSILPAGLAGTDIEMLFEALRAPISLDDCDLAQYVTRSSDWPLDALKMLADNFNIPAKFIKSYWSKERLVYMLGVVGRWRYMIQTPDNLKWFINQWGLHGNDPDIEGNTFVSFIVEWQKDGFFPEGVKKEKPNVVLYVFRNSAFPGMTDDLLENYLQEVLWHYGLSQRLYVVVTGFGRHEGIGVLTSSQDYLTGLPMPIQAYRVGVLV